MISEYVPNDERDGVHPVAAGFPWQRFAHVPRMRPSKAHDLLLRSIRRLGDWDIKLPPDSRIARAERVLARWTDTDETPKEVRDRALIAEGIRTAAEFYMATHGRSGAPSEELLRKSRQALSGADLPVEEKYHFGRDIQFELNVHGVLAAGGVRPWFDERPDIRFSFGNTELGVAVKRLWSQERAHNQLSDAAGQIAAAGLRGIIATNVQEYLAVLPAEEAIQVRGDAFNRQVARLHGQFPYLFGKQHIVGMMLAGTVAEWSDQDESRPPQLRIATYNQILTIANDDAEQAELEQFFSPIELSLRRWIELNM